MKFISIQFNSIVYNNSIVVLWYKFKSNWLLSAARFRWCSELSAHVENHIPILILDNIEIIFEGEDARTTGSHQNQYIGLFQFPEEFTIECCKFSQSSCSTNECCTKIWHLDRKFHCTFMVMGTDLLHLDIGDKWYPCDGISYMLHGSCATLRHHFSNLHHILVTYHVWFLVIHDLLFHVRSNTHLHLSI